jgi:DNA-binding beta-propeller fold protein YncE
MLQIYTENIEIARRRSERVKVKKATHNPGKLVTKAGNKTQSEVKDNWVDYILNRKKTVKKKLEDAERGFTVKTEIKPGNLVLIFSAAAYVEFKIITKSVINNSGLSIDETDTRDKTGAVVSESLAVRKENTKIFVLNFYNTSSKVLLNGNQLYIIDLITSSLSDILGILDRNEQFKEINNQIRDYCKTYLDSTCTHEINQEGHNEK